MGNVLSQWSLKSLALHAESLAGEGPGPGPSSAIQRQ